MRVWFISISVVKVRLNPPSRTEREGENFTVLVQEATRVGHSGSAE